MQSQIGEAGASIVATAQSTTSFVPPLGNDKSKVITLTRADYYDGLRGISDNGDWEAWVRYFLNGVARQSEDALSRAERLNQMVADWRDRLSGQAGTKVALQLLDILQGASLLTLFGRLQFVHFCLGLPARSTRNEKPRLLSNGSTRASTSRTG